MHADRFIQNLAAELDLRQVPPGDRTEQLLRAYRRLAPEDGFVLVDRRDPAIYLNLLQSLHPGEFNWIPVTIQPGRWRIGLSRRSTALSGPQRVVRFMTEDHLRLSLLLRHVCKLLEQGNLPEAARACGFLCTILARHIKMEEEVLFTIFSRAQHQLPEWHSGELRQEHREVMARAQRLKQLLAEAAGNGRPRGELAREVPALADALEHEFGEHAAREERLLYAWVDMLLEPVQIDLLVNRIQAITAASPPL